VIESLAGQGIDVSHACRVLGVSQSGYYEWKTRPISPRALRRIWLAGEIADVHKASAGTYGALRVTAELRHGREIVVGHNAVESIMRELGIKGLPTRRLPKRGSSPDGNSCACRPATCSRKPVSEAPEPTCSA
jgi:putative transposase